jgi:hypothetical protein
MFRRDGSRWIYLKGMDRESHRLKMGVKGKGIANVFQTHESKRRTICQIKPYRNLRGFQVFGVFGDKTS